MRTAELLAELDRLDSNERLAAPEQAVRRTRG